MQGNIHTTQCVNTKDAPIVGSAYQISAYRCAIARIGIGQIIADTADYRVAHAQTIYCTDQRQGVKLMRLNAFVFSTKRVRL